MLILLIFKNTRKKTRKIKIYKKKKVEGPILIPEQHFTYKYGLKTQKKGRGGHLVILKRGNTKKRTLKIWTFLLLYPRQPPTPWTSPFGFFFSSTQSAATPFSSSQQAAPPNQPPPSGFNFLPQAAAHHFLLLQTAAGPTISFSLWNQKPAASPLSTLTSQKTAPLSLTAVPCNFWSLGTILSFLNYGM